ncbi:uncharacterized protein LOC134250013 [Saccostrea cucullata]|uniref:uncharacterized protein LOC134250013 n=1 Tax=Saccostrea cuccullata TaxID=36930 RepID=UPI002ED2B425
MPDNITSLATPGITKNNITRGGTAFLIRNKSDFSVKDVQTTNERIMGIEITYRSNQLFIIGCLLPSTNHHYEEYKRVMQDVFDLFDELSETGPVILCGDFNTDIRNKPGSPKSKLLTENTLDRNLCSIFSTGNQIEHTFQTKDKKIKSLLDYIFVPECLSQEVKYKEVYQDFAYKVSDHYPLLCEIDIASVFAQLPPDYSRIVPKWKFADTTKLEAFKNSFSNLFNPVNTSSLHKDNIDTFLVHITASLLASSDQHIPHGNFNPHLKPYWKKSELNNAHYDMRCSRRTWKSMGSPRDKQNEYYENYKKSKRKFRKLHRLAQKDWHNSIFYEIDKAAEIDIGTFYRTAWKNKKRSGSSFPSKLSYKGKTAENINDMCNLWQKYYSDLANEEYHPDKFDENFTHFIDEAVQNIDSNLQNNENLFTDGVVISIEEVKYQIDQLTKGKAPGPDFLTNEHLIYSGHFVAEQLCLLFNAIIREKYVPEIFKFGFRNDYGAIPACYVLKEAISYYVDRDSPVFCAFLDNEKAFDRIWHNGILLADDTALMSNSPTSLQCLLNLVENYAFTWRLHYNPSKYEK